MHDLVVGDNLSGKATLNQVEPRIEEAPVHRGADCRIWPQGR